MSGVIAAPDLMTAAAMDLANIGSTLSSAHAAAALSTRALLPAAADEVSANIALVFSAHAEDYQAVAVQAAALHQEFVEKLTGGAASYGSTEAASVAALRPGIADVIPSAAAQSPLNTLALIFNLVVSFFLNPIGFFLNPILNAAASMLIRVFVAILAAVLGQSITFTLR